MPSASLNFVSRSERDQQIDWIEWAISRYAEWLGSLKTINLKMLILFGSYAKGNFVPKSDVDIIVVADGLPEDTVDCHVALTDVPDEIATIDFQTHPYAPEDFIASLTNGNKMPVDALVEGQIIHIDPDYRQQLLAAL